MKLRVTCDSAIEFDENGNDVEVPNQEYRPDDDFYNYRKVDVTFDLTKPCSFGSYKYVTYFSGWCCEQQKQRVFKSHYEYRTDVSSKWIGDENETSETP